MEKKEFRIITNLATRQAEENSDEFDITGVAVPYGKRTTIGGWFMEEFRKGALDEIEDSVVLMANHNSLPLARVGSKTLRFNDKKNGLHFTATLDKRDPLAQGIFVQLERDDLDGVSAGFIVRKAEWHEDDGEEIRVITKVDLREISLTPIPAYADTNVKHVREERDKFFSCLKQNKQVLREPRPFFTIL